MLILSPEADDAVVAGVTDRVGGIVGQGGGQVSNIERWGKRRLAYPIDRQSEGFYMVIDLQAEPAAMKELDRVLALSDPVIRFKVVVRGDAGSTSGATRGTADGANRAPRPVIAAEPEAPSDSADAPAPSEEASAQSQGSDEQT